MKRVFVCAAILIVAAAVAKTPTTLTVTVKQLLETPAEFAGKRVDVTGYYRTGTEDSCLLACKRCADDERDTEKSIWLDPVIWDPRYHPRRQPKVAKSDAVDNRIVRVMGTFRYEPQPVRGKDVPYEFRYRGFGCYNLWARQITDITYLQPVK